MSWNVLHVVWNVNKRLMRRWQLTEFQLASHDWLWHPSKSHFPPAQSSASLCVCVCVWERERRDKRELDSWENSHSCLVQADNLFMWKNSTHFLIFAPVFVYFTCQPLTHLLFQSVSNASSTPVCTAALHYLHDSWYIELRKRKRAELEQSSFFRFFNHCDTVWSGCTS